MTVIEESKVWTLQGFADEFFELQTTQIREHTLHRNIMHYNNHIAPYFGSRELVSLTPIELEKWQNQLLQKYKHLTVQKFRSILFSIFDKALHNELIPKNPLEKVTAPKVQNDANVEEIWIPQCGHFINIVSSGCVFIEIGVSTSKKTSKYPIIKLLLPVNGCSARIFIIEPSKNGEIIFSLR